MNKKRTALFILILLLTAFSPGMALGNDLAVDQPLIEGSQVTLTGQGLSGQWVTVMVTRVDGNRAYIGQQRTSAAGDFAFVFTLNQGNYSASISSRGQTAAVDSIIITADPTDPGGNGNSGGIDPSDECCCFISVTGDAEKGSILGLTQWKWTSGRHSVTDVLGSILNSKGISFQLAVGGAYIKSIDGLTEKKPGHPLSGWLYRVNGVFPGVSPADYMVQDGDVIDIIYTLDGGQDVGAPAYLEPEKPVLNTNNISSAFSRYANALGSLGETCIFLNTKEIMSFKEAEFLREQFRANQVRLSGLAGPNETFLSDEAGEVLLFIPEKALQKNLQITVTELDPGKEPTSRSYRIGSSVYEFGPEGTQFDQPVSIIIKCPLSDQDKLEGLTPARYDGKIGEWIPFPGVIDLEEGLVIFNTDHFSQYAVVQKMPPQKTFSDVGPEFSWAEDSIEVLAQMDIVKGVNGCFEPGRDITRAEMLALLIRAGEFENPVRGNTVFSDVAENHWFFTIVQKAYALGLVKGYPDGSFKPGQPVTWNEAAAVLDRMAAARTNGEKIAGDDHHRWPPDSPLYAKKAGLFSRYAPFQGDYYLSRAEAAVLVHKNLKTIKGE
ncbi:MAG: S-layer homology domain-containing protein [Syntrophomonadaceae bacterium]